MLSRTRLLVNTCSTLPLSRESTSGSTRTISVLLGLPLRLYVQQKLVTRFVIYDEFFSIRKCPEEILTALTARVEQGMSRIKELRSFIFNLTNFDNELFYMAMIHALGLEYYHFTSSLTLLTDLDKDKIKAAFQTEEIN
ncbi:hypothetical protein HD554DRAFT_2027022 [Boletus coccyginus]|nr:hypothetical protein HD554DRAFT_2027022 [Boletus coccyginus]